MGRGALTLIGSLLIPWAMAPALAAESVAYSYDARGRLIKVERAGSVRHSITRYTIDKADNRIAKMMSSDMLMIVPASGYAIVPIKAQ